MTLQEDAEKLQAAVNDLKGAIRPNLKLLVCFLAGWIVAWIIVAVFTAVAPERLCL